MMHGIHVAAPRIRILKDREARQLLGRCIYIKEFDWLVDISPELLR